MTEAEVIAAAFALFQQGMKAFELYKTLHTEGRVATDAEKAALFGDNAAAVSEAQAEVARRAAGG